jgi:hypothetical protein
VVSGINLFASSNGNDGIFLAVAVAVMDGDIRREDFFIRKNPDLPSLTALKLVEELLAHLLPPF